ncbi:uncharacterized protein V1518DRAFT_426070 [Limtongia smithiae]|uniref:uncharacterized protein n=1 Tax=Limtongia smithiae TaxID=1125753 RepID=UPI0034CFC7B2
MLEHGDIPVFDFEGAVSALAAWIQAAAITDLPPYLTSQAALDLDDLAVLALHERCTTQVLKLFYPIFSDIAARWLGISAENNLDEVIARAFARVVRLVPQIAPHAEAFFKDFSFAKKASLPDVVALYRLVTFDQLRFGALVHTPTLFAALGYFELDGSLSRFGANESEDILPGEFRRSSKHPKNFRYSERSMILHDTEYLEGFAYAHEPKSRNGPQGDRSEENSPQEGASQKNDNCDITDDGTNMEIIVPQNKIGNDFSQNYYPDGSKKQVSAAVRVMVLKLCGLHMGFSECETNKLMRAKIHNDPATGEFEDGEEVDYMFFDLWEAKRITTFQDEMRNLRTAGAIVPDFEYADKTANICGVLVPRLHAPETTLNIVFTGTTVRNVRSIASAMRNSEPILVSGAQGSGKTFLINFVLSMLAKSTSDIIRLHLGEQTDTKMLIGTYSSGDTPGSFVWKYGVLANAVRAGKVLIIEDIDRAPNDVISVMLSLLQHRQITIPSRGVTLRAGPGFQMIATVTEAENKSRRDFIGRNLWSLVRIDSLTDTELQELLMTKYPALRALAGSMQQCFVRVQEAYFSPEFLQLVRGSQSRAASIRDLIKWADRLNVLLFANSQDRELASGEKISSESYNAIFMEAIDCFVASLSSHKAREYMASIIASSLNISPQTCKYYTFDIVPEFQETSTAVIAGRAQLQKSKTAYSARQKMQQSQSVFAHTKLNLRLLEQIATCVKLREPVLLVGETGTGKTSTVQELAASVGSKLVVLNLSQQTDTSDLLGGYKPVDAYAVAVPLKDDFENLFEATFSSKRNERFNTTMNKCFANAQWNHVIRLWNEAIRMSRRTLEAQAETESTGRSDTRKTKRRRLNSEERESLSEQWQEFESRVTAFMAQYQTMSKSLVYKFIEGALVRAVRQGDWVLLDEINLASSDTLESLIDLLAANGEGACIHLTETGDLEAVNAHPDFRLFACMNPATDVGKRDLPSTFRTRFTELYVPPPEQDPADLLIIVEKYLSQIAVGNDSAGVCSDVAELYLAARNMAENHEIIDGASQKPHFSIRTLARALQYARSIASTFGLRRALYEAFCMSFATQLNKQSREALTKNIALHTIDKLSNQRSVMRSTPPKPTGDAEYVQFKPYWLEVGEFETKQHDNYIVTPSVQKNLLDLVRAASTKKYPVLIQGPTSSGKTSMISYIAKRTSHKMVRINNHEHTDLQEYLGTYVSDQNGNLVFQDGVLVEAARKGYWIVLDELNLAPTDVLEALNRLLDDNHEIFIPETQEVVRPHPQFLLFATQNPSGLYGGRKTLSRAFRNRFLEIHFDDIPETELEDILKGRCAIPPSYAKRIVQVYKELAMRRQSTRLFEKDGFATLRDLFRWANREAVGYDQLALNGYLLLAERVRSDDEKYLVKDVIETVMKVKLNVGAFYESATVPADEFPDIVWSQSMRRLYVLVKAALAKNEPVLLIGETGCGKTTIVQVLAKFFGKELHTVNAHQNTEASDIIGAQRPVRNRIEVRAKLESLIFDEANKYVEDMHCDPLSEELFREIEADQVYLSDEVKERIRELQRQCRILFQWSDGSLVQAMRSGDFFLLDEISLTDDSVLERLNSVLEPERSILLAEKGIDDSSITASDGFQFLATMNPSGDYGKKELSPALRNRFTEIWVPPITDVDEVYELVNSKLDAIDAAFFSQPIVSFAMWFAEAHSTTLGDHAIFSLRDLLTWISFIKTSKHLPFPVRLLHGASMVFIDTLGTNTFAYLADDSELLVKERLRCVDYLSTVAKVDLSSTYIEPVLFSMTDTTVKAGVFEIPRNTAKSKSVPFSFSAPTTAFNAMRIVRGMQLRKPIMLEGSPGVGKTSIMTALAAATGMVLTRINLSEQTDLMDLFGSDSPVEGGKSGEFAWRNAPFLDAMENGYWVLLDEMNLASQSVLEGLNACLDHRGEAYIPELDRTFTRHKDFKIFAAQNPHSQGGGRKGLPKSFINRFTLVYVDLLTPPDLQIITSQIFPSVDRQEADLLIGFISLLELETTKRRSFGQIGAPWEFNLRDTLRWFHLLVHGDNSENQFSASEYLDIIVKQRFRTSGDRVAVDALYEEHFGRNLIKRMIGSTVADSYIQFGHSILPRQKEINAFSVSNDNLALLQCNAEILESLVTCVRMSWPTIITGPSNAGKTSLIRLLARLTGNTLEEFSISTDTDTGDIIGGYEQVDFAQHFADIWKQVKICQIRMLQRMAGFDISSSDIELFDLVNSTDDPSADDLEVLSRLLRKNIRYDYNMIPEEQMLQKLSVKIDKILIQIDEKSNMATFEWYDGILVKALERGHWLVLDNANLCGPSVLDRLNSLLEQDGVLSINERGLENGKLRIIKPHKNFRLFLTVDPRYGELSRAMRNRGIEIFVDDLNLRATSFDKQLLNTMSADFECAQKSIDISEELGNLSMIERTVNGVAAANLPVTVSSIYQYGLLDAVASMVGVSDLESLALASVDYLHFSPEKSSSELSFVTPPTMPGWISSIRHQSVYNDDERALFSAIESICSLFGGLKFANSMMQLYERAKLLDYSSYQSLQLWSNPYNMLRLRLEISEVERLSAIYDLAMAYIMFQNEVSFLDTGGDDEEVVYGSPLLAELPRSMVSLLADVLENFATATVNSTVKLQRMMMFLRNILTLARDNEIDESQYPILGDTAILLTDELMQNDLFDISPKLFQDWLVRVESLSSTSTLKTGKSMDLLWKNLHGPVPKSHEQWNLYLQVFELGKKLEGLFHELGYDDQNVLIDLQTKILGLLSAIVRDGANQQLVDDLSVAIETFVADHRSPPGETTPQSVWSSVMAHALLMEELSSASGQRTISAWADLRLVNLAGTSFTVGISQSLTGTAERDISSFTRALFSGYKTTSALDGSALFLLSAPINSISSARAGALTDSHADLKSYGYYLANAWSVMRGDKMLWIYHGLLHHMQNVVKLHEEGSRHGEIDKLFLQARQSGLKVASTSLRKVQDFLFDDSACDLMLSSILESISDDRLPVQAMLSQIISKYSESLLLLYIPDRVYDPAIRPYVQRNLITREKRQIESSLIASKFVQSVFSGDQYGPNWRVMQLEAELQQIGVLPALSCFRPKKSQSQPLFQAIYRFYYNFIAEGNLVRCLDDIVQNSANATAVAKMFCDNASQFIQELEEKFPIYTDILRPIVDFVRLSMLATELMAQSNIPPCREIRGLWMIDGSALRPGVRLELDFKSKYLTKEIISCALLWMNLRVKYTTTCSTNDLQILHQILTHLHYTWTIEKRKLEVEQDAKTTIYKFASDEEAEMAELREMFPDYSSDDQVIGSRKESSVDATIFNTLLSIFGQSSIKSQIPQLVQASFKSLESLLESAVINSEKLPVDRSLSAVMLSISNSLDDLTAEGSKPNFYTDQNVVEVGKVSAIITIINIRITEFSERWPENEILMDCLSGCSNILNAPVNTPIARFLALVERELESLHEWQKFASRDFSVNDFIDDLSQLIIAWRRLELSSWASLFDVEVNSVNNGTSEWLFLAYESIIATPQKIGASGESLDEYLTELVQALSLLVGNSPIGQVEKRLQLLIALADYAEIISSESQSVSLLPVSKLLRNVCKLYSQFVPSMRSAISAERQKLEKEMSEIILLASWKDTNFLALKESARRSHYKLFKIVKKFRTVLTRSARDLLDSGLPEDAGLYERLEKPKISIPEARIEQIHKSVNICSANVANWTSRPKRLIDISGTTSKVQVYASEILNVDALSLVPYALDLVEHMKQLRKETPRTLTSENKTAVQFLKSRKAKLLSETLKDLKKFGLRFRVRPDILATQDSVGKILTRTRIIDDFESDVHFFRVLEILPRIRTCETEVSEDLTPSQISRAIGCAENLLNILLTQRDNLGAVITDYHIFLRLYDEFVTFSKISADNSATHLKLGGGQLDSLLRSLNLMIGTLDFSLYVVYAQSKLSGSSAVLLEQKFRSWQENFGDLTNQLHSLTFVAESHVTSFDRIKLLNDIRSLIASVHEDLITMNVQFSSYSYVTEIILRFVDSELQPLLEFDISEPDGTFVASDVIQSVDLVLRRLMDSVLVVVQNLRATITPDITIESNDWILLSTKHMTTKLQSLDLHAISKAMKVCMASLNELRNISQIDSSVLGALFEIARPIVEMYANLAKVMLTQAVSSHDDLAKAATILLRCLYNVAKSGFCSPEEESQETEGGQAQQGTGLGDGDGEQNVSNTVEDNENMEDIANEKAEKDDDKRDDDKPGENEDAVDIDGDMEGEVQDLSDRESNDNDEDDEPDDDNEDIDEEVGNVDQLDPSTVDEKMWNDKQEEENLNERDHSEQVENSTKTDDLQAKTDEKKSKHGNEDEMEPPNSENENKDEEDDSEDAMEQQDNVRQQQGEQMEDVLPEGEVLDLPEDLNLDNDDDETPDDGDDAEDLPPDYMMDEDFPIEKAPTTDQEDQEDGTRENKETSALEDDTGEEEAKQEEVEIDHDIGEETKDDEHVDTEKDNEKKSESKTGDDDKKEALASEGLTGPEQNDENEEAAARGQDGAEKSGLDDSATNETDGAIGNENEKAPSGANESVQNESNVAQDKDTKSQEQTLGDTSEEYHRMNEAIEDAENADEMEDIVKHDASEPTSNAYRHLDESQASFDTQALGAATKDQQQTIDDDMAIDDDACMERQHADEAMSEMSVDEVEDGARGMASSAVNEQKFGHDKEMKNESEGTENADHLMEDIDAENPDWATLQILDNDSTMYRNLDEAREMWQSHERGTADVANALCEQLRLILEPTKSTKLRGDYRTGKRLNMKRIIPYIASEYRKDKIWLRRTKPSKREYQIMISLDDSKSMDESRSVQLAFDSMAVVSKALEKLEAGEMSVVRFGEKCDVVHPFDKPFSSEAGARVLQWFGFKQERTDMLALLRQSISLFEAARSRSSGSSGEVWQLEIIISDGLCEDHEAIRRVIRRARDKKIMIVFIIVDSRREANGGSTNLSSSIVDLSQVTYETDENGQTKLKVGKYLHTFPFDYYTIVRDIGQLPAVLAMVLRQFFAEVAEME